jgi:hypothetical protein
MSKMDYQKVNGKSLFESNQQRVRLEYLKKGWTPLDPHIRKGETKIPHYTCFICLLAPLNFMQLRRHMLVLHNKAYIKGKFVEKPLISTQNQQSDP